MSSKLKQTIFSILGALLVFGGTILAGSLTPSAGPTTPTMYTLSDIYNKLTMPSYTPDTHSVSTTTSPTPSFNTLTEIWSAIPSYLTGDTNNATSTRTDTTLTLTIPIGISDGTATVSTTSAGLIAGNILSNANIFGLTGTANDSAGATEGRTLATTDKIISDSFAFATDGTIINGTGSAGAAPLEWSSNQGAMTWDAAVAYCANPANGYTRLPKVGEILNALSQQFAEGGTEGPGSFVDESEYWSGIESASSPGSAWKASYVSRFGFMDGSYTSKSGVRSVRCVR